MTSYEYTYHIPAPRNTSGDVLIHCDRDANPLRTELAVTITGLRAVIEQSDGSSLQIRRVRDDSDDPLRAIPAFHEPVQSVEAKIDPDSPDRWFPMGNIDNNINDRTGLGVFLGQVARAALSLARHDQVEQ